MLSNDKSYINLLKIGLKSTYQNDHYLATNKQLL